MIDDSDDENDDVCRLDEIQAADVDKYHCPKCTPLCGPSIMKKETNWHRHDRTDPEAPYKPLQVGTKLFVDELSQRFFSPGDDIITKVTGRQLTLPYLNISGFTAPILVTDKEGLGLSLPPTGWGVGDVCEALGGGHILDMIDCHRQKTCQMTIDQFSQTFSDPSSDRVLNCLSLELSELPLADLLQPPLVARKLCWVNNVWPSSPALTATRPQVQKYCIMSMKNSYTDFHIDFGGTSVWYHAFSGEKHFFLIKPTPGNLSLYERWMRLSTQSETFLGDMVDKCYKLELKQGQTLFIPTGWIHAVYTPVNSVVFGGNFLHSLNIQLQLKVYELESRLKDPPKYRFPSFEVVHWLAGNKLKNDLADLNSDNTPCPTHLLNGIRALVGTLKNWISDSDKQTAMDQIDCVTILKDLHKEVKTAEKIALKINPPKPERESSRKRKKKSLDDDFIDLSDPSSMYLYDWNERTPGKKQQAKKKSNVVQPTSSVPAVENELEEIMSKHNRSFSYESSQRTVSPLRLNLSLAQRREALVTPEKVSEEDKVDLTDRDAVRQLMVNKAQLAEQANNLNSALGDFCAAEEEEDTSLVIDEAPRRKQPLKLRLSVGGSDFSINSGPVEDNVFGNSSKYLPGMIIH